MKIALDYLSLVWNSLNAIQQVTLMIYTMLSLGAFARGWRLKRKITIGTFGVTLMPLLIGLIIVLGFNLRFEIIQNNFILTLGAIIYLAGTALAYIAGKHLGIVNNDDFWWSKKEHKPRHLVTTGPYSYIRHPIEAGFALLFLGLTVVFFHPVVLAIYVAGLLAMFYTSCAEEEFMEERFSEYSSYKSKTGRFLPRFRK